jgi:hypothetical protein
MKAALETALESGTGKAALEKRHVEKRRWKGRALAVLKSALMRPARSQAPRATHCTGPPHTHRPPHAPTLLDLDVDLDLDLEAVVICFPSA